MLTRACSSNFSKMPQKDGQVSVECVPYIALIAARQPSSGTGNTFFNRIDQRHSKSRIRRRSGAVLHLDTRERLQNFSVQHREKLLSAELHRSVE